MGSHEEYDPYGQVDDADCPYKVAPSVLNDLNENKDMAALAGYGGVQGLAKAMGADAEYGLESDASVQEHLRVYGANKFEEVPPESFWSLAWGNCQDPVIVLLCAAAAVSTALGAALPAQRADNEWIEGVAIWVAVICVVCVGAGNDYQKEKQFRKLNAAKDTIAVKVLRGGSQLLVKNHEVTAGDIIVLDTGDKIIADGLIVSSYSLVIDEASLTGESEPIKKDVTDDPWLRSGTQVTEGSGHMLVTAVGPQSEWGKTMELVSSAGDEETPLQVKLEDLAGAIGKVGLFVAACCFVALLIKWCVTENGFPLDQINNNGPIQFFLYAVTIVVVAVPEGLPLAVTISLAYSMKKMMADQNFVRVLSACETMGGATAICSDKTGTLTENRMTVTEGWFSGVKLAHAPSPAEIDPALLRDLQNSIALNSKAFLIEHGTDLLECVGNRTDCAMLMMLRNWGCDYKGLRDSNAKNIAQVYGFSSAKKMASVLVQQPDSYRLYNKGAAEWVLAKCVAYRNDQGAVVAMTEGEREKLVALVIEMASRGLRCLCLAYRDLPLQDATREEGFFNDAENVDCELTAVAILGIKDPLRPEVPAAVATCQAAGITIRMVTGDNIHTARHIARDCGILTEGGIALEGPTFRNMSTQELLPLLPKLQVLARSSPEDKLLLVRLLKEVGEIVAVTGDGTNDAPALKESDVGLAMGIAGTEVAKEAADIVIMDDNFTSIVKSVLWGRSVFANIQKFLQFQLTVNFVALVVAFVGAVVGGRIPLNVLQLLWVNLVMDTMGALALATEPPSVELLREKPHGREAALITGRMWKHVLVQGCYQLGWMFFFMYGLPNVISRYAEPGQCPLYATGASFNNPIFCEQQAQIAVPALNSTEASQLCAVINGCGFPCGVANASSCPLITMWPAGQMPADLQTAVCGFNNTGCPVYQNVTAIQNQLHSQLQDGIQASWTLTDSLLFNAFIWMQVFNEINARRINDEYTIFTNLFSSHIFLAIIVITCGLQAIIMNGLYSFFKVVPLEWHEWLVSIAIGAGSIPVSFLTRFITRCMGDDKERHAANSLSKIHSVAYNLEGATDLHVPLKDRLLE